MVVILNLKLPAAECADGSVLYSGLRTSTVFKLRAGKSGYVALFAYDSAGNVSAPARRTVSLASLIPLRPLTGSRVTSAPLMTWTPKQGTAYYNVQVFRNGKRILVDWPSSAFFRLPANLLEPGIYTWYVWPAIKARACRRDLRRPDRPRDLRLRGVGHRSGRARWLAPGGALTWSPRRWCAAVASIQADCGRSSVGRASASQAEGREFEPRRPLRSGKGIAAVKRSLE